VALEEELASRALSTESWVELVTLVASGSPVV
jgi:hypothetical protein